jgi:hypothetical protein
MAPLVNGQGCCAWKARRAAVLRGAVPVPGAALVCVPELSFHLCARIVNFAKSTWNGPGTENPFGVYRRSVGLC